MRASAYLGVAVGLSPACGGEPADSDIVLTETMEPESFEVIDCGGGSILPATLAADNYGLSVPDTLVFLGPDVQGVHIHNCTMSATFPIVAVGGGDHRVQHNDLDATSTGVLLLGSDDNLVDDNAIASPYIGVLLTGDSDGNVVSGNHLDFAPEGRAVEGRPGLSYRSQPFGVAVLTYTYPGVSNVVVNGALHQAVSDWGTHPDETLVVDNTIHNDGGTFGILFAARSSHPTAWGNTVHGGLLGLGVAGNPDGETYQEAGTCSEDPSQRCDNSDPSTGCAVPGLEPQGTCQGVTPVYSGGRVVAPAFVNNAVSGATIAASAGFSDGYRLERNDLADGEVGIELWAYSLVEGTIRGNATSGFDVGLRLTPDLAMTESAGADVSYNDFGDNEAPFDAFLVLSGGPPDYEWVGEGPYTFETSLPHNWWGSEPCGLPADSEWWPNTDGPDAFAEPVALAWRSGGADGIAPCEE